MGFEEEISLRASEEKTIKKIIKYLPLTIVDFGGNNDEVQIAMKVNVLLQTHFMRRELHSFEIREDRKRIVSRSLNLLHAMIDILSTAQVALNGVLVTIQMLQMITQSMWETDSYLLQLPYFTAQSANYFKKECDVTNVYDLLEMNENDRNAAFAKCGINEQQIRDIAIVCNQFPDIDLSIKQIEKNKDNEIAMIVYLERDQDDNDDDDDDDNDVVDKTKQRMDIPIVNCPRFPLKKEEFWYLIVGNKKQNKLVFVKRFSMKTLAMNVKIKFAADCNNDKIFSVVDERFLFGMRSVFGYSNQSKLIDIVC